MHLIHFCGFVLISSASSELQHSAVTAIQYCDNSTRIASLHQFRELIKREASIKRMCRISFRRCYENISRRIAHSMSCKMEEQRDLGANSRVFEVIFYYPFHIYFLYFAYQIVVFRSLMLVLTRLQLVPPHKCRG
jgi:hypothetical protein